MDFIDEILEHLLRDEKIGNYTVFQRSYRCDIAGRAPEHPLGVETDGRNAFLITLCSDSDDRWLVENNALVADVNKGICCTKIDR